MRFVISSHTWSFVKINLLNYMEWIVFFKSIIDIFNYIKRQIKSKIILILMLLLCYICFLAISFINYAKTIPNASMSNLVAGSIIGKLQYHKDIENCELDKSHFFIGTLERLNPYRPLNKNKICFKYDIICNTIINIIKINNQNNPFGYVFYEMPEMSNNDRYKKRRVENFTKEDVKCNTFFEHLIAEQKLTKNFVYRHRQNISNCKALENTMFGFEDTVKQHQVSIYLTPAPALKEIDNDVYMIIAFINENEVQNIKCKKNVYLLDSLIETTNKYYVNRYTVGGILNRNN